MRTCTICTSGDRQAIDAALIGGAAIRDIAGRYGLSKSSVERHKREHLPAQLVRAKEAEGEVAAADLLRELRRLQERAVAILTRAEKAGQLAVALHAIREAREGLKLMLEAGEWAELERRLAQLEAAAGERHEN